MSRMPSSLADVPVRHPLVLGVLGERGPVLATRPPPPQLDVVVGAGAVGRVVGGQVGEHRAARRAAPRGPPRGPRPPPAPRSPSAPALLGQRSAEPASSLARRASPTCRDSSFTWARSVSWPWRTLPGRRVELGDPLDLGRRRPRRPEGGRDGVAVLADQPDVDHERPTLPGRRTGTRSRAPGSVPPHARRRVRATSSIRYGATHRGRRRELQRRRGEVVAVLGPNGAGKTSTVETPGGLPVPARAAGSRVLGLDPRGRPPGPASPRIGVMLQRGGVYPMLGPRRVVELFAGYYHDPEPTDDLLDLVGLRRRRATPWRHLSGGEQQRLVAGPGAGRTARGGVPGRADRRRRPRGAGRAARGDPGAAGRRAPASSSPPTSSAEAERLADRVVDRAATAGSLADGRPGELAGRRRGRRSGSSSRPGLDLGGSAGRVGAPVAEDAPGSLPDRRGVDPGPHRGAWPDGSPSRRPSSSSSGRRRRSRRPTSPWSAAEPAAATERGADRGAGGVAGEAARRPGPGRDLDDAAPRRDPARHRRHPGRSSWSSSPRSTCCRPAASRRSPSSCPGVLALAVMSTAMVVARHRHRVRTRLRRAEAPRRDAPAPGPTGRGQDRDRRPASRWSRRPSSCRSGSGLGLAPGRHGRLRPRRWPWCCSRTVAFGGLGLLLAGVLRAEVNLAAVNGLYLVLLLLGGMLVPHRQAARRAGRVRQGAAGGRPVRRAARHPRHRRGGPGRVVGRARRSGRWWRRRSRLAHLPLGVSRSAEVALPGRAARSR